MNIGIITHYYKSINYGGNLQAYALCEILNKSKHNAEQICYPTVSNLNGKRRPIKQIIKEEGTVVVFEKILNRLVMVKNKVICRKDHISYLNALKSRASAFEYFNSEIIPNSQTVYTDDTIQQCNERYDIFISGSDQVWNFNMFRQGYFLVFVENSKKKLSYAASVSMPYYNELQQTYVREALMDFSAVSVREDSAKSIIQPLTALPVQVVVDPVLLLKREDWERICNIPMIKGEYILTYFLGMNPTSRKLCKKFAKQNGLKIVEIKVADDGYRFYDKNFGDIVLDAASPQEFITLIRDASYVFTDSFHAVVFSNIFERQYFVFDRDRKKSMNSRIVDITQLFHTEEHYCNGPERTTIDYINGLKRIDYSIPNKELQERITYSYEFLKNNLSL